MCHFVTLIVPVSDPDAVRSVMERHGRAAWPSDNPSLRSVLREGERQYLTTRGHCDCGTVLAAHRSSPEAQAEELARETARLKRKGWSDTKVARAIEDRRRAGARPGGNAVDSVDLWDTILEDLGSDLGLPYAGLFVRPYSGDVDTERFDATRREVSMTLPREEALGLMEEEEVTIFPLM
jgi:hypothetical protein